jgi:hypothetical protein
MPYHLFIPTLICAVLLILIIVRRKELFNKYDQRSLWISIIAFLTVYGLVVGGATYDDIYYQWDLNRYDLDGNGFFEGKEITKDQEAAMNRLTNDVGRNFSVFTGLIFSAFLAIPLYFILKIVCFIEKKESGIK